MALISSKNLVLIRASVIISMGLFLIKDPELLATNRYVLVTAYAMEIPIASLSQDNPLIGLAGILLLINGLSDVPPVFSNHYLEFLDLIIPIRLAVFFAMVGYSYLRHHPYLSNSLVFCYGFVEIMLNFIIYIIMREERNETRKVYLREDSTNDEAAE